MRLALSGALILSSLAPSLKAVCSAPQPRLVCAEYSASTFVVEAVLNHHTPIYDKREPTTRNADIYTFHVERVFRGELTQTVTVYETNDSGRATFDWIRGEKYLLFLFRSPSGKFWELDGCGNSGPLTAATKVLSQLAAIDTHSAYGSIYGAVSHGSLSARLPGVHVAAKGNGETYNAATNENGEFNMRVPVGTYSVEAFRKGLKFDTFELSYSDRNHLQVEPGGCVQVQLIATQK